MPSDADTNLFTIDLYPTRLYLATGQDKTVRITLTRAAGFEGNVRIAVSGIPESVSTAASFTILAGQERRFLTFAAGADAAFTTSDLVITGTATLEDGIHTKTTILPVTITRQRGPFREVVPAFPGSGHEAAGPDNGMVVTIEPEPAEGPYQKYSASFRTADGRPVGGPIRFFTEPGSRLGGVSFCDKSKTGVMLSVNARSLGFDADAMLAVLDFTRPKAFRAYEVRMGTAGGGPVRPRVFVSPDCTFVAFMEAAVSGSSRTTLTLVDVMGGSTLVEDMPFHGARFAGRVLIWKERLYVEIRDGEHVERVQVPLSGT